MQDKPQVLGSIKNDDLKGMNKLFEFGLMNGFKWVEAVGAGGDSLNVVGHTTVKGRDKTTNTQRGRAR